MRQKLRKESWATEINLSESRLTSNPLMSFISLLKIKLQSFPPFVSPSSAVCSQATRHSSPKLVCVCIRCFWYIFLKYHIWLLAAATRDAPRQPPPTHKHSPTPIIIVALFCSLLNMALHSQVRSPRNSLTLAAGRVVTVMHGCTERQPAERLHESRRTWGGVGGGC